MTTILIVDDDPGIGHALAMAFADEGYAVVAVNDGMAALAVLARRPVAVVVSDVAMPRLGGLELLAILRERGDPTPVVLMSAAATARTAVGYSAFVAKPFDLDELLAAVKRAIAEAGRD